MANLVSTIWNQGQWKKVKCGTRSQVCFPLKWKPGLTGVDWWGYYPAFDF
jgi:hypothetical protein